MKMVNLAAAAVGVLAVSSTIAKAECVQTGTITSVSYELNSQYFWGLGGGDTVDGGEICYRTGALSPTIYCAVGDPAEIHVAKSFRKGQVQVEVTTQQQCEDDGFGNCVFPIGCPEGDEPMVDLGTVWFLVRK